MNNCDLVQWIDNSSLNFDTLSYEQIEAQLSIIIQSYIDSGKTEALAQVCYRIDLAESKYNAALQDPQPAQALAKDIISRTYQKYLSRRDNPSSEINDEELKW